MDEQQVRERLEAERVRLERIRASLAADPETSADADAIGELSHYDQHPGDLGTETFEHEKNLSLLEQVDAELDEVAQALHRVERGTYGVCQACGKPIGAERLEAMPAARFCVEDQAKAERASGGPRART